MARKVTAKSGKGTTPTATPPEAAAFPPPETVVVRSHRIACDGVGGALGHPRVWLEMGEGEYVECPYCDRRFVRAHGDAVATPGVYEVDGGH
jgi:uncharacterized Zn-finger protein